MSNISKNDKVKIIDQRPLWKDKQGTVISTVEDQVEDQNVKVKVDFGNNKNVIETFLLSQLELLETNNKSTAECLNENTDISMQESADSYYLKEIDAVIQSTFSSKSPGDGCIFIAPNGNFINIYPKLADHEDLTYWLQEQGFNAIINEAEWFVEVLNYVRCRNSRHQCYIEVPIKQMTREQYDSLQEWIDAKVQTLYLDVEMSNGDWNTYSMDEYFSEDIIEKIKRAYASGKLYENYNTASKETTKDIIKQYLVVSDFDEEFKNSWYFASKIAEAENLDIDEVIKISKKFKYPVYKITTQIKTILIIASKDITADMIEDDYGRFLLGYIKTERV